MEKLIVALLLITFACTAFAQSQTIPSDKELLALREESELYAVKLEETYKAFKTEYELLKRVLDKAQRSPRQELWSNLVVHQYFMVLQKSADNADQVIVLMQRMLSTNDVTLVGSPRFKSMLFWRGLMLDFVEKHTDPPDFEQTVCRAAEYFPEGEVRDAHRHGCEAN